MSAPKKTKQINNAAVLLTGKSLQKLQEIWLDYFHKGTQFKGGNTEQWFTSVLDFLSSRGDEVIPFQLREQEERLLSAGKSQEYMAALAEVVNSAGCRSEYDKAVLVLTATAEERSQAIAKVLS